MSKRSRIILLIILVLPVLFFLTLQFGGKNKYKDLPHLGIPEGITEKGDTVWHTLPPFSFTDQNGNSFGSTQLKGKIFVAEFFFTRCPTICPIMMENLKKDGFAMLKMEGKIYKFHKLTFRLKLLHYFNIFLKTIFKT